MTRSERGGLGVDSTVGLTDARIQLWYGKNTEHITYIKMKAIITIMFFFTHNDRNSRCALKPHETNKVIIMFCELVYYIDTFSI